jgi:hypothetical protein
MAKVLQVQEVPIIQVSTMCFPLHAGPNFGWTLDKNPVLPRITPTDHNFPAEESQSVSPLTLKQIKKKKKVNILLMFISKKYCTYQPTYHYPIFTLFLTRKNSKLKKRDSLWVALLWSQMTMDNKCILISNDQEELWMSFYCVHKMESILDYKKI